MKEGALLLILIDHSFIFVHAMPSERRQLSEHYAPPNPFDEQPRDAYRKKWREFVVQKVSDRKMHPSIPEKVAREVVAGNLPDDALIELLDTVERMRRAGEFSGKLPDGTEKSSGRYFVASLKHLFTLHDIPWRRW